MINRGFILPKASNSRRIVIGSFLLAAMMAISLQASTRVWDGSTPPAGVNWGDKDGNDTNWIGQANPNKSGYNDDVQFAGSLKTSPNMEDNYDISAITFNSGASPFTLTNTAGTTLGIQAGITNLSASTQTINISSIRINSSQTFDAGTVAGGSLVFGGSTLNLDSGRTLTIAGSNNTSIANAMSGSGSGILKTGTGTLTLTGASTFTGTTVVAANGGTLKLDSAGSPTARLANTSGITINSGGTLLLANSTLTPSSDRINNSATVELLGGKIDAQGLSEGTRTGIGVGALTLTGNSIIDFGTTVGTNTFLHFAASNGAIWTGTLDIYNWTGSTFATNPAGNGMDQLLFGTNNSSLTQSQLDQIRFFSDAGVTFLGAGIFTNAGVGEVVPMPEPTTVFSTLVLVGLVGYRERRHLVRYRRQKNR